MYEVEFLLTMVGQAPSHLVQVALLIPMKALISDELFRHSNPDVRIMIASCLNEVTRITAPIPPFEDDKMKEFFELIVASFENLSCQPGRCYSKAVSILQSVARLRSCVILLDLDCDPLVTKMFELFQKNISPKHPQAVLLAMVDIMSVLVQESDSVSLELLKSLLASIKMENQSVFPASWELGAKIIERCADKLKPFIMETVSSMGCCLEDFPPILSSICNPTPDSVTKMIDSSFLANNEPSEKPRHPAECVQSLTVTEGFECVDALGTGGISSKRELKWNSRNLDNETTGVPSVSLSHRAEYVQALEAPESFEFVNVSETGGTASERRRKQNSLKPDDEATGLHQAANNKSGNPSHSAEFVQALEALESSEYVNISGTDEATCLEREHDHPGTSDGDISRKDVEFKTVKEENDGFENQPAEDCPSALGNTRRKRGRPRKNAITGAEKNNESSGNPSHLAEFVQPLEAPESSEYANISGTEEATCLEREHDHPGTSDGDICRKDVEFKTVKEENDGFENQPAEDCPSALGNTRRKRGRPRKNAITGAEKNNESSGNPSHSAEFVQALEAPESSEYVNISGTEEVTCLERKHDNPGTSDGDISRKDVEFKTVKEENDGFENRQAGDCSSALGNTRRKRGRPRKNAITGAEKNNDVSWGPEDSEKKLLKQHEFSETKVIETRHGNKSYADDVVGRRIKVWWPLDRRYYEGTVTMFDASTGKHKVDYDDGDEEILSLRKESWKFTSDETPTDFELNLESQDVKERGQP
ncbi:hypothetical protein RND81_14G190100 [Saponaria officinalis]|uniref:PTM/DIR17-like Tudor domain-containing protein n=1 Tax=Saponaria officinalis TaxID=3572 RepID=A0AAW1GNQ3_SAPOF